MDNANETPVPEVETMQFAVSVKPGPKRRMIGRVREHRVEFDVSEKHGGEGAAPSPPEYLVLALGGCLVNISRMMAEEKGLALDDLEVSIHGEIDPLKAMGVKTERRAGFEGLSVEFRLEGNLTADEKKAFFEELWARCPLCDTIQNMTAVTRFLV